MNLPGLEEKYEVIRPLGEGGMGVVYLAVQKRIDRKVAIKSIAPYLARDPAVRERFTAEAAVLARLNHPNIVTLYDYIEEEGALYLIMEYVEGQPLSDLLKAGPLPRDLIQKYFSQVLEAFAYAHEQGVVHRDIKPSNIMITAGGRVKILDFGVARLLQTDHSLTRTGMRIGTLMYMSPEQVKGEKDITNRSDIYSLGVVLYELLTGRPPYPPDMGEFDISVRIVQEPLFDLSHPPSDIPARLLEVILRATEKDPSYRYADCHEFLKDFESAFGGEKASPSLTPTQVHAVPSQTADAAKSSTASSKKRLLLPFGIGALLVAAIVGGFVWYSLSENPVQSSESSRPETLRGDTTGMTSTQPPSPIPSETTKASEPPQATPPPAPSLASSPSKPNPAPSSPKKASPTQTQASKPIVSSAPASKPKPRIQTEIKDFKESSLVHLKAKGTLVVRNVGEGDASSVILVLSFFNKRGEKEYSDTLHLPRLKAGESLTRPFQARVNGIKSVQVEVLSPRP